MDTIIAFFTDLFADFDLEAIFTQITEFFTGLFA